jgi:hypothetical protein
MVDRRHTKALMRTTTVRMPTRDLEVLYLAAKREGISQSEFFRSAVREKAARVLVVPPGMPPQ